MAADTSKSWKNRLQEYCQKNKLPYPNYRFTQQSDASNRMTFQAEVELNGRWYAGEANFSSKKDAEQSAAERASHDLWPDDVESHSEVAPGEHMPEEYAHIERFLINLITECGGRIRKIRPPDAHGRYRVEIGGGYRLCENVKRHHTKNGIYFLIDPKRNVYYQRCYDPGCQGFQSAKQPLPVR